MNGRHEMGRGIRRTAWGLLLVLAACNSTKNLGSVYVKSGVIGPAGGSLTVLRSDVLGTPALGLAGTSITIPAGALAKATNIEIGFSTDPVVPTGGTADGPVVDFEPSGTLFAVPVTIQIPATPPGVSAMELIAVVEATGSSTSLPIQSFGNGLATFQASGFSLFGAYSTSTGCTKSNMAFLLESCHVTLGGGPDDVCVEAEAAAGVDVADAGLYGYMVDACDADDNGPLVSCILQDFPGNTCLNIDQDGGNSLAAIESTCGATVDGGGCADNAGCAYCQDGCANSRSACNEACIDGGIGPSGCLGCSYDCDQTAEQCNSGCLSYDAGSVQLCTQPSAVDFGDVQVDGTPATQTIAIDNCGQSPVSLTFAGIQGAQAADFGLTTNGDVALLPSQSVNIVVAFSPKALGPATAELPYSTCPGCVSQTLPLSGVGVDGMLTFAPSPVDFVSVPLGSSPAQQVVGTNTGTEAITVTDLATFNNNDVFTLSGLPQQPFMIALAPQDSFTVTVTYNPTGNADMDQLLGQFTVADPAVPPRVASDNLSGT